VRFFSHVVAFALLLISASAYPTDKAPAIAQVAAFRVSGDGMWIRGQDTNSPQAVRRGVTASRVRLSGPRTRH
jgi:hypothetical protein